MRLKMMLAATAAMALCAASANAAVTYAYKKENQLNAYDSGSLLIDFDGFKNANVNYVGNIHPAVTGTPGSPYSINGSAPPPFEGIPSITACCRSDNTQFSADSTAWASVQGGQTATFSATNGAYFKSFSFYMGSPDEYNRVTFHYADGSADTVLQGNDIWGNTPQGTGDRKVGYRNYYDFGGSKVSSIDFYSRDDAFEYDNFAGKVGGVPEPASWALMIGGFGAAGAMLRRRRSAVA